MQLLRPVIWKLGVKSLSLHPMRSMLTVLGIVIGLTALIATLGLTRTAGNRIISDVVDNAKENVRQGHTLAEPLMESKVFPPMVTRMVGIGEKTGSLETLLEKISEFYDQQVETEVKGLTSLIEPIMIAIMGVVVGGIVGVRTIAAEADGRTVNEPGVTGAERLAVEADVVGRMP